MTGGAGFIGISLVEALIDRGDELTILDDFSSSNPSSISSIRRHKLVKVIRGDCRSRQTLRQGLKDVETVFHLAANPEVRNVDPEVSFRDNVESTKAVLEGLARSSAEKIVFTSSSTVYGDAKVIPTPEDYRPLMPISVYGATKLISEALVSDYSSSYGFHSAVLRLANIVGPRSNHGVLPDFIRKLKRKPDTLKVLGDGSQSKSYLHVEDCVAALMKSAEKTIDAQAYNVGSRDALKVTAIAHLVAKEMGLSPSVVFEGGTNGGRGWVGDVKNMLLDITKLVSAGWAPKYNSRQAVLRTVRQVMAPKKEVQNRR